MRNNSVAALHCDIFCTVVDNYGDIGVCWRLARQLAHEHGVAVRLWVDDLASFRRLCPEVDAALAQQHCRGVEVRHWGALFPEVEPANLVIEAFACELPQRYVAAMAAQERKPVWLNLEYLSAEDWVEGCHKLPSPHPSLPLVKYFFFPGFTPKTGGLLLERDLLARRDAFQRDPQAIAAYWESLGISAPQTDETRVSLFSYENTALPELLRVWEQSTTPISCFVPEGRALPQVAAFFGQASFDRLRTNGSRVGEVWQRGNLEVRVLPFVEQERYDELLWACDINFVRGEDSCVRAQWAGKPFVWHIYPQHDGVHMQKLRAFMDLYCAGLSPDAAQALHGLWEAWNGGQDSGSGQAWNDFWRHRSRLRQYAHDWAQELSVNSLVLNLLDFSRSIDRMRDPKNLA
jgi:uncharacterized repeat protein (TIGR03837 family)